MKCRRCGKDVDVPELRGITGDGQIECAECCEGVKEMSRVEDGGTALPSVPGLLSDGVVENRRAGQKDDTPLWDEFAGIAMRELVVLSATGEVDDYEPDRVAHDAYNYADAMMKEREARKDEGGKK